MELYRVVFKYVVHQGEPEGFIPFHGAQYDVFTRDSDPLSFNDNLFNPGIVL